MPLIRVTLDNAESVSIVVRQAKFDRALLPAKAENVKTFLPAGLPIGVEMPNLTAAAWNDPENDGSGCLRIVEVGGVAVKRNR